MGSIVSIKKTIESKGYVLSSYYSCDKAKCDKIIEYYSELTDKGYNAKYFEHNRK